MKCFSAENLPVLSRLASEYAVCDAWFSSVPGPTWPNRFFAHAATSRGSTGNRLAPSDVRTIYHHLTDAGVSWKIFFHDLPQALGLRSLWPEEYRRHVRGIKRFYEAAQAGTLPAYSFIEPRYFSFIPWADRFGAPANDQHPPHDVNEGEELIAAIYQVLRASPQWERTLLVVTYDEHGGCYDHQSVIAVPPPEPPPAGAEFDFATTGVRVPAVVVSPWIDQGKVDSTPYDHATIPATLKERFGLANYLTARDAAANTLGGLLTLTVARADAIVDVAPPRRQRVDALIRREMVIPSAEAVREAREESMLAEEPLSDFQETLVELARTLEVEGEGARLRVLVQARRVRTEEEGAEFVQERARRFLNLPDDE
jgi:phospholipase C